MALSEGNPLVTSLAGGEPEGYAALYDRLGGALYRTARAMLKDSADAQDAVQDVFIELVRNRHRLSLVRDLDAYVFAMLRHGIGRRLTHRKKDDQRLRQLAMMPQTTPDVEIHDDVEQAMATLPAEQREVIAMKISGGLTFAQIAQILDISPNTAASRYRYALEKLKRILE